jgi:hypothetical protein
MSIATAASDEVVASGGPTSAATATNASDKHPSAAADTRHHRAGFRTMMFILSSKNDFDSDIPATAPI